MIKIFNDRYELLEFKKKNIYDFTEFDTIIIKFDLSTKCIIKANKIICLDLTALRIYSSIIYSIGDITCNEINANSLICNTLLSDYVKSNNIEALEIKGIINISAFNIMCDNILSFDINCHYINCDKCFTDKINAREQHIKHMYTFDEYCLQ